jgi:hypothetical protein
MKMMMMMSRRRRRTWKGSNMKFTEELDKCSGHEPILRPYDALSFNNAIQPLFVTLAAHFQCTKVVNPCPRVGIHRPVRRTLMIRTDLNNYMYCRRIFHDRETRELQDVSISR